MMSKDRTVTELELVERIYACAGAVEIWKVVRRTGKDHGVEALKVQDPSFRSWSEIHTLNSVHHPCIMPCHAIVWITSLTVTEKEKDKKTIHCAPPTTLSDPILCDHLLEVGLVSPIEKADVRSLTKWITCSKNGPLVAYLMPLAHGTLDRLPPTTSWEKRRALLYQYLLALAHLHRRKILHLDLKCTNLFYELADNSVHGWIGDVDLGEHVRDVSAEFSCLRDKITSVYRTIEHLKWEHEVGIRSEKPGYGEWSDMWSMGQVSLDLFCGIGMMGSWTRGLTWMTAHVADPKKLSCMIVEKLSLCTYETPADPSFFVDLVSQLLNPRERQRPSAARALVHPFFTHEPIQWIVESRMTPSESLECECGVDAWSAGDSQRRYRVAWDRLGVDRHRRLVENHESEELILDHFDLTHLIRWWTQLASWTGEGAVTASRHRHRSMMNPLQISTSSLLMGVSWFLDYCAVRFCHRTRWHQRQRTADVLALLWFLFTTTSESAACTVYTKWAHLPTFVRILAEHQPLDSIRYGSLLIDPSRFIVGEWNEACARLTCLLPTFGHRYCCGPAGRYSDPARVYANVALARFQPSVFLCMTKCHWPRIPDVFSFYAKLSESASLLFPPPLLLSPPSLNASLSSATLPPWTMLFYQLST